jgi:hypoxanthine-guanine phosphoribosyltransferase
LAELDKRLSAVGPKSIDIAVLVSKPDKKHEIEAKFVGLNCSDFIIGYGLDLDEYFRCLP